MGRRGLVIAAVLAVSCNSILGNGEHYYVGPAEAGDAGATVSSEAGAGDVNGSSGSSAQAGSGFGGGVGSSGASGAGGSGGSLSATGGSLGAGGAATSGAGGTGAISNSSGGTGAIAGTAVTGGTGAASGATAIAGDAGMAPAGSAGAPNLLSVVGGWDGALVEYGCGNSGTNYDCVEPTSANCTVVSPSSSSASVIPPSNGAATSWPMGGTPGISYNVTVRVRGVVEVSCYHGGTRAAGEASVTLPPRNLFQTGGTPLTYADLSNGFDYDEFELDVTPISGTPNVYFLNSVITSENPHTSVLTHHLTFDVDYTVTIPVPGGGTVSLKMSDSNCDLVQNCGPSGGGLCSAPRTVPLDGADPMPTGFVQPFQMPSGKYGQWLQFDVSNVTVAP